MKNTFNYGENIEFLKLAQASQLLKRETDITISEYDIFRQHFSTKLPLFLDGIALKLFHYGWYLTPHIINPKLVDFIQSIKPNSHENTIRDSLVGTFNAQFYEIKIKRHQFSIRVNEPDRFRLHCSEVIIPDVAYECLKLYLSMATRLASHETREKRQAIQRQILAYSTHFDCKDDEERQALINAIREKNINRMNRYFSPWSTFAMFCRLPWKPSTKGEFHASIPLTFDEIYVRKADLILMGQGEAHKSSADQVSSHKHQHKRLNFSQFRDSFDRQGKHISIIMNHLEYIADAHHGFITFNDIVETEWKAELEDNTVRSLKETVIPKAEEILSNLSPN